MEAGELSAEKHERFLDRVRTSDPGLHANLEALLAGATAADEFFEDLTEVVAHLRESPDLDSRVLPRSDPLIGEFVDHYRIESRIGSGGMGTVYLAHDTKLERPAALKFLPRHLDSDGPIAERFLLEARAAAAIDHPNVCTVYEIGQADGRRYIAMAHYQGETLREILARGPLPLELCTDYAGQIAAALGAAHRKGIVHRDIKPGNVIVTPEGVVKVLDFGLAKLVDASLTRDHQRLGTVAYMAPEQLQGRAVDPRTDLWALGVVWYEMLTGRRPFTGEGTAALVHQILHEHPPPLRELRPDASDDTSRLIHSLLERVPEDRPESTDDVLSGTLPAPRRWPTVSRAAAAVAGLLIILAAAYAAANLMIGAARPSTDARAVAVLPCEAGAVEAGIVSLGDRWAEELIRKLGRVAGLRPKEWESVKRYRESGKTAEEVGSELRAGSVVRCAVVEDPDTVRLTADLIRVDDSSLLWSQTFQRPSGRNAVNDVQSDAALGLARALGVEVPERSLWLVGRPLTEDTAALRLYRLGQQYFEVGTREAQHRAIVYLDSAILRDSAFAVAYAALARSKIFLGEAEARPGRGYYAEAGRLLRRAIELDGTLPEARTWFGAYLLDYTHDWEGAEEEHRRAIALNPASWQARTWYGFHLQTIGRLDDAVEQYEEALAIDPVAYFPRLHLARCLAFTGRLERASEENRLGRELHPEHAAAFAHNEAIILLGKGLPDSAAAVMEGSTDPYTWWNGPLYALAGRRDLTRRILDSLVVRSETEPVDPLTIALQHVGLRQREEALVWLERAYAERSSPLLYALGRHIWTEPLWGDPEFEALRARVGFTPDRARGR